MTPTDAGALRRRLADELQASGVIRTPAWRAAVEHVSRHEFLREGLFEPVDGDGPTRWRPVSSGGDPEAWLAACYADETHVTQLDGATVPSDVSGVVAGVPSSSSTLPGLVVRMLEDLDVEPGMRVLEIGTGSGYSTALMCDRLGPDLVTSIELDPAVGAQARVGLERVGYAPRLVIGDGLAGHEDGAPYDRLIATCSVRRIPPAWLRQVRPGGIILVTVTGWLYTCALARLTVAANDTAEGEFLTDDVSFMIARPQAPPGNMQIPGPDEGAERTARVGPAVLDDWTSRFVAQCAAPWAQHARMSLHEAPIADYLIDARSNAFAIVQRQPHGAATVRQGGTPRLWDDIENAVLGWQATGAPPIDQFRICVTPDEQTVSLDTDRGQLVLPLR